MAHKRQHGVASTSDHSPGTNNTLVGTESGSVVEKTFGTAATANHIVQRDSNGDVLVPNTPTATNAAASKDYVDSNSHTRAHAINSTSDHTAGTNNTLLGTESSALVEKSFGTSATAGYIVQRDGSGDVIVPSVPSSGTAAASKEYVDSVVPFNAVFSYQLQVFSPDTEVTIGDGKTFFVVPAALDGRKITNVEAAVFSAGTTGTLDIQIHNVSTTQDILSTKLTIDSGETHSKDAATPHVIDATYEEVSEGDILRVDIDAVQTTPPEGLYVLIEFENAASGGVSVGNVIQEASFTSDASGAFTTSISAADGLTVTPFSITITPTSSSSAIEITTDAILTTGRASGSPSLRVSSYGISRGNSASSGTIHNGTLVGSGRRFSGRQLISGSSVVAVSANTVNHTFRDYPATTSPVTYTLVVGANNDPVLTDLTVTVYNSGSILCHLFAKEIKQ